MLNQINPFFSWISERGVRPEYSLGKTKYIKLVNQLCLLVAVITFLLAFFTYPEEPKLFSIAKAVAPLLFLSNLLLSHLGHPKTAKIALYLELYLYCLLAALLVGGPGGVHLFFIPIIFGSTLVFDMRRRWQCLLVLFAPLAMLGCLWVVGDSWAIDASKHAAALQQAYVFNFLVTILISFVLSFFYFRTTNQQQQQLSRAIRQLEDLNVTLTEKERSLKKNLQYSDLLLENLKASKNYFESVIQNATDVICIAGNKGLIKYLTPSFYRLTGYAPDDIRNQAIFDFIHPDDVAYCQEHFFYKGARGSTAQTFIFRCRKADGDYLYMEASGTNLLANNSVNGIVINARDITLQKQAELALIDAKEKAEEATRIKAQFLSTMSHEIRTPMNAVIGMSHLLLQEDPRPDQLENLRILRFSAENLLSLINDVLDYNKIEAGKIAFESTPFDLPQLVSDLKNSLHTAAQEKGLQLEVLHDTALPQRVLGDPLRLSQVLSNLLSNAIKFTEAGRVCIRTSVLKADPDGFQICFRVEDTGIGIEPDKLQLIFESFAQAEVSTTRRFGGTGLGLAISKRLLELQNSQITVESRPGQGSVFSFVLSFDRITQTSDPMHAIQIKPEDNFSGACVLLVEDNPLNRFVAEKFLCRWGLEVRVAETGQEALTLLQLQPFHLVLMDLQLPDIDGFQVVEQLRNSQGCNTNVPVMAMSAAIEPHVQAQAFASGMQGFVVKPFNPEDLKQKIYDVLEASRLDRVGG